MRRLINLKLKSGAERHPYFKDFVNFIGLTTPHLIFLLITPELKQTMINVPYSREFFKKLN